MKKKFAILILLLLPHQLFAQEKTIEENPWKSSLGLSLVTVSGNTSSQTLSITGDAIRKGVDNKLEFNVGTVYGKSEGEKTAEYWYGKAKYDKDISQRTYCFTQVNTQGNRLSGYNLRFSVYPGVGYHFLKEKRHSLFGEIGPGYFYEKRIGEDEEDISTVSGRAYAKYAFQITESTEFSQDGEYLHNFDNSDDYRVNANTALIAKISDLISLKVSVNVQYVNAPPDDNKNTDVFTSTSLIFTF